MTFHLPRKERRQLSRFILTYIHEAGRPVWIDELVIKSGKYLSAHEAVQHRRSQYNAGDTKAAATSKETAETAVRLGRKMIIRRQIDYLKRQGVLEKVDEDRRGREISTSWKISSEDTYKEFMKFSRIFKYTLDSESLYNKVYTVLLNAVIPMTYEELARFCNKSEKGTLHNTLRKLRKEGKVVVQKVHAKKNLYSLSERHDRL